MVFQLMPPSRRNKVHFAYIPNAEDGKCPMLSSEGWCSVHAKHGADLLPMVCQMYPRRITIVGDRAELTGHLSCPEVARRALLHEGACEVVEVDRETFPDMRLRRTQSKAAFELPLDAIRGTLHQLFGLGHRDDVHVHSQVSPTCLGHP